MDTFDAVPDDTSSDRLVRPSDPITPAMIEAVREAFRKLRDALLQIEALAKEDR